MSRLIQTLETSSQYDLVIVTVENSLVHTKSGDRFPRNIADFMPDYNLWYALKYCSPKNVIVIENQDLTSTGWGVLDLHSHETRYSFITKWLSQMINIDCVKYYSIKGNWKYLNTDHFLIDLITKRFSWARKILYIDKNTKSSEEFIRNYPFEYVTTEDFINKYNKNPRKYEKK